MRVCYRWRHTGKADPVSTLDALGKPGPGGTTQIPLEYSPTWNPQITPTGAYALPIHRDTSQLPSALCTPHRCPAGPLRMCHGRCDRDCRYRDRRRSGPRARQTPEHRHSRSPAGQGSKLTVTPHHLPERAAN